MQQVLTASQDEDHTNDVQIKSELSADAIAIYQSVIEKWLSNSHESLNVAAQTYPLGASPGSMALGDCACSNSFPAENILAAAQSFRTLAPNIIARKGVRLVSPSAQAAAIRANDPGKRGRRVPVKDAVANAFANGLFSLSEIAFDSDHKHALVSYSFHCGALCGSGATLLFEKKGNEWKRMDQDCGGWIS
ncbi:MAG TPA: hypothetical protein VFO39_02515 [Candidatus Sulfotelmatobacter sp.]|nr:hypothetical protein [Candidatus Sulfotelmatobacter sp.]